MNERSTSKRVWERIRHPFTASHETQIKRNKKIRVVFQFGEHRTEQSADALEPLMANFKPHVLALENANKTEAEAREIEKRHSAGIFGNPFAKRAGEIMARHNAVPLMLERIDPKTSADIAKAFNLFNIATRIANTAFSYGNAERTIKYQKSALAQMAIMNTLRERAIHETLRKLYKISTQRYPHLKKEPEIRVVVGYGIAHTGIFINAHKLGFGEIKRDIKTPTYFDRSTALTRQAIFGKPVNLSDHEIAKDYLAGIITGYLLHNKIIGFENAGVIANHLVKRIDLASFKRICTLKKANIKPIEALEWEEITVPKTREDAIEFLKKRHIPLAEE